MNNAPAILRTFIMYAVCVPLAMFIGYLLANPLDYSTMALYGTLALVLCAPLMLRWHHWLLLLSWNFVMNLFFLKGSPSPWLVMTALSLGISIFRRSLIRQSDFIRVPEITRPLIFMTLVVLATAKLTGGFGLRMLGSEVYGGRKYIFTIGAILGYYALTAVRIPPRHKKLAMALFFGGGVSAIIGELYGIVPSGLNFIFWFFTPDVYAVYQENAKVTRFAFAVPIATGITSYMLAYYGIRGMFLSRKPWRWIIFGLASAGGLLGGFRGFAGALALGFFIQFFLEGMHRTKLLPIFGMVGLAAVLLLVPLTPKLPLTFQRALAFLPLPVDPMAEQSATESTDWRYKMWAALMPQIPKYFLLGKGYGFAAGDFTFIAGTGFQAVDAAQQGLALAMDYHNGWISVLITFGVWGMIAFLWFALAGIYVLYSNYRYGDPELRTVNAFLLATFVVRFLLFMSISGLGLHADLYSFAGWLGFGISLNGGVCRRPVTQPVQFKRSLSPAEPLPPPRPALQH
jgi:hypothetical protein